MTIITFDTLKLSQKLEGAGFTKKQAAGAAEALSETFGETVVTREYLDLRLKDLEHRLTIRLGGMLVTCIAVVAALVKLL